VINRNVAIYGKQRTSIATADAVLPKTGTWRRKIYDYVQARGFDGATDQEIESALRLSGNTERPTRITLVRDGYLIDTGRTRRNELGHECIVWACADQDGLLF